MTGQLDINTPHPARVYDWLLGGKDNFAADREFGQAMLDAYPEARMAALENRAFMRRVVTWLAREAGIRQFIDVGTGIPTSPNVHEVAQNIISRSRVVYVDNDPLVLSHARALLVSHPDGATGYVESDVRDPEAILSEAGRVLDMSTPVALTMIALLHYVPDGGDPYGIVARLIASLPSGSYLALSHGTHDLLEPDKRRRMQQLWARSPVPSQVRSRAEVERFFDGLELVPPGVVPMAQWKPDETSPVNESAFYAGAARVP